MDVLDEQPSHQFLTSSTSSKLIETEDQESPSYSNSLVPVEKVNTTIRSSAVVTYSKSKFPAFLQLSPHTNLNLAPSNWLRSGYGIRPSFLFNSNTFKHDDFGFSSFYIADTHLHDLGEIDVISDAENIKKLLKVPYSKSQVSLAIHPIGKTLLVEEMDGKKSFHFNTEHWKWFEDVSKKLQRQVYMQRKKLPAKQIHARMLSKLYYYSIKEAPSDSEGEILEDEEDKTSATTDKKEPAQLVVDKIGDVKISGSGGVKQQQQDNVNKTSAKKNNNNNTNQVDPNEIVGSDKRWKFWTPGGTNIPSFDAPPEELLNDAFERTIKWKFEDLNMVLGSNLTIFGKGEYPAVTLRLRDSDQPINVLTGLDYWLDNLICNVPEVVMCFHCNGIVQNYEVVKTEDIPNLKDSRFNPVVVKDIAKNILSFLKSNCTKEGHTYWLFKGEKDDVVKLYDLTTLSANGPVDLDGSQNPYKIPVATLLYKMAVNLIQQQQVLNKDERITLRKLLRNCVQLLDYGGDGYVAPVMLTGALYILSSLGLMKFAENTSSSKDSSDAKTGSKTTTAASSKSPSKEKDGKVKSGKNTNPRVKESKGGEPKRETPGGASNGDGGYAIATIESVDDLSIPHKYTETTPPQNLQNTDDNNGDTMWHEPSSSGEHEEELDSYETALDFAQRGWQVFCLCSANKTDSSVDTCLDMLPVHRRLVCNTVLIYHALAQRSYQACEFGKSLAYICLALNNQEYLDFSNNNNNGKADDCDYEMTGMLLGGEDVVSKLLSLAGDAQMAVLQTNSENRERYTADYWKVVLKDEKRNHQNLSSLFHTGKKYGWATKLAEGEDAKRDTLITCFECFKQAVDRSGHVMKKNNNGMAEEWPPTKKSSGTQQQTNNGGGNNNNAGTSSPTSRNRSKSHHRSNNPLMNEMRKLGYLANELSGLDIQEARRRLKLQEENCAGNSPCKEQLHDDEERLWKKSFSNLQVSYGYFQEVGDSANQALVLTNMGQLMRICAQSNALRSKQMENSEQQMNKIEGKLYEQAVEYYQKAISTLHGSKQMKTTTNQQQENMSNMINDINWELAVTYYNFAIRLQDNLPSNQLQIDHDVERKISDLMNKAIKICTLLTRKLPHASEQFDSKCAGIHHRLASLHHNSYKRETDATRRRRLQNMADNHYMKSANLYSIYRRQPVCELQARLGSFTLFKSQFTNAASLSSTSSNNSNKNKHILEGFTKLSSCSDALQTMHGVLQSKLKNVHASSSSRGHVSVSTNHNSSSVDPPNHYQQQHDDGDDVDMYSQLLSTMSDSICNYFTYAIKIILPPTNTQSGGGDGNSNNKKKTSSSVASSVRMYKDSYARILRILHQDNSGGGNNGDKITKLKHLLIRLKYLIQAVDELKKSFA